MVSMYRGSTKIDQSMLAMALVGYEIEKGKIQEKINEIRARLGHSGLSGDEGPGVKGAEPKRRKFSKAARKRMAAAQKKRWAERRKQKAA